MRYSVRSRKQEKEFNYRLKSYCKACGCPEYSSHRIRNYSITEQARENPDITQIQYNSGHLDPNTTLGYIHRAQEEQQNLEEWRKIHG